MTWLGSYRQDVGELRLGFWPPGSQASTFPGTPHTVFRHKLPKARFSVHKRKLFAFTRDALGTTAFLSFLVQKYVNTLKKFYLPMCDRNK